MPIPASVDPIPLPPRESRLTDPDEAQLASYFAASANIASFARVSSCATRSSYVLVGESRQPRSMLGVPAGGGTKVGTSGLGDREQRVPAAPHAVAATVIGTCYSVLFPRPPRHAAASARHGAEIRSRQRFWSSAISTLPSGSSSNAAGKPCGRISAAWVQPETISISPPTGAPAGSSATATMR